VRLLRGDQAEPEEGVGHARLLPALRSEGVARAAHDEEPVKLHLVSARWPGWTECQRLVKTFDRRFVTSDRAEFTRRKLAKPGEVCGSCANGDEARA
jgi:hypothetical protein